MNNILMVCFRISNNYSTEKVAASLGISNVEYVDIENGITMPTRKLTGKLGKLYKIDGDYFYEASIQLEDLLTGKVIINILRNENKRMNALLEGGYELINASKKI